MKRRIYKKKMKRKVIEAFNNNEIEAFATIDGKRCGKENPVIRDLIKRNLSSLWQPHFKAERRRQKEDLKRIFGR